MRSHHVGQAGLELLTSSDLSALASQSAGINRHEPPHPADLHFFNVVKSVKPHMVYLKYFIILKNCLEGKAILSSSEGWW